MPQYSVALKHCSAVAVQDSDVQKQCGDLAEVFVAKGTNLLDLSVGTNMGARAGWPKERVAGLKQELDALTQAMMQLAPSAVENQWTCSGVDLGNTYIHEVVQMGELGAAREVLVRSGETAPELARKWQEYLDRIRRESQQDSPP